MVKVVAKVLEPGTPEYAEHIAALEAVATAVPSFVSPLQFRRALRASGIKAGADAYIATLDEEAMEAWEYAVEIRRRDPMIVAAAAALNMSEAEADDLFRLAATL